jgi:hypothetical protein
MLFAIVWANRAGATEETDKRSLKLFTNWQPPAGLDFKGFYDYADGNGGIAQLVKATEGTKRVEIVIEN